MRWQYFSKRRMLVFLFLSLIFCFSCASSIQQAALSGIIKGIAVDENQKPIKGAKIEVRQIKDGIVQQVITSTSSDNDGEFNFSKIPDTSLLLIIDASISGYIKSENYISQCTGSRRLRYIIIKDDKNFVDKVVIFGKVMDVTGKSLFGASVQALPTFYGDASAKNGTFKISDAPPGEYQFRAAIIGYAISLTMGYHLDMNEILNINFLLQPVPIRLTYQSSFFRY